MRGRESLEGVGHHSVMDLFFSTQLSSETIINGLERAGQGQLLADVGMQPTSIAGTLLLLSNYTGMVVQYGATGGMHGILIGSVQR